MSKFMAPSLVTDPYAKKCASLERDLQQLEETLLEMAGKLRASKREVCQLQRETKVTIGICSGLRRKVHEFEREEQGGQPDKQEQTLGVSHGGSHRMNMGASIKRAKTEQLGYSESWDRGRERDSSLPEYSRPRRAPMGTRHPSQES